MAVTTRLTIGRDEHLEPTYAIAAPAATDEGILIALAPSGTDSITIPADTRLVMFTYSPGSTVFISNTAAIVLPASGTNLNSVAEINPAIRECAAGETWNFTNGTGDLHYVQVRFFKS